MVGQPVKRDFPDAHTVRSEHLAIHDQLLNWARVVRVHAQTMAPPPMFRHYRCDGGWGDDAPAVPLDLLGGWQMERSVSNLPDKHREAIRWHYVRPWLNPYSQARRLAVTQIGLIDLVHQARAMLKNRA